MRFFKHKCFLAILFFSLSFLPFSVFAQTDFQPYHNASLWNAMQQHFFVRAEIGAAVGQAGKDNVIHFSNQVYNAYYADRKMRSGFDWGLIAGFESALNQRVKLDWGLGFYQMTGRNASGEVWQYNQPDFHNLNYRYTVRTNRLLTTTRWLVAVTNQWSGFVDAGVGVAWVTGRAYQESPLNNQTSTNPYFQSNTESGFAYQFDVGVAYQPTCFQHWRWSAGVGYVGLPTKAEMGLIQNQQTNQHLEIGNVNSTRIFIGLTYH